MSALRVVTEAIDTAAHDLANIETALSEATSLAAAPTTGILPAAADEVSAAIAGLFSEHGQQFQQLAAQAQALHQQFVQTMASSAQSYLATEEQNILGLVNEPTEALFNRPLIGNGANGTATSPNGQPGGFLWGNGGNGFLNGNGGDAGLIGHGGNGGDGSWPAQTGGNGGNGGILIGDGGVGGRGGAGINQQSPATVPTNGGNGGNGGNSGIFYGSPGVGGNGGPGGDGLPGFSNAYSGATGLFGRYGVNGFRL